MKAMHLTAAHFTKQPWRNGGGYTTQLAVDGDGERWIWRLSLAEVRASGPFSDFSGYDRTLVLVEGAGMELAIDGQPPVTVRDPLRPFSFDGGATIDCTLIDGPVRDLNLMVERRRARATLEVVDANAFRSKRIDAPWTLVYALRGSTRASMTEVNATLAPGELLRIDDARGAELDLVGLDRGSRVALARIHPIESA
jgi:environmental stress-induced protein Ves